MKAMLPCHTIIKLEIRWELYLVVNTKIAIATVLADLISYQNDFLAVWQVFMFKQF